MSRLYIAPTGLDTNDGLSFETAKRTLAAAFVAAKQLDVIQVAPGSYPGFTLPESASRKLVGLRALAPLDEDKSDFDWVMDSGDLTTTEETEAITEAVGAARGMRRVARLIYESVALRRRAIIQVVYINPVSSKAWAAEERREQTVEVF